MMMITIFTPTYNRADTLHRLYYSLLEQNYKNFEWIIVDDGSADNTEDLVQNWMLDNKISIVYHKQANGGKHRAINKGLDLAKGELFFIVDSDDFLPENSLEIVIKYYLPIKDDKKIIGIVGLMGSIDGNVIGGKRFDNQIIDSNLIERRGKYRITADMAKVIKTELFREFYFPDIPKEKFVAESIVWNRMAVDYNFRYFNEIIYTAEYREGGLSNNSIKNRRKNPIYATMLYRELFSNPQANAKIMIKSAINYWRFAFCNVKIILENARLLFHPIYLLTLPIGLAFNLKDKKNNKIDIKKINR